MSFRYENYGTANLLSVSGTTVNSSSAVYGTAFYQTRQQACFGVPASRELWVKFDVYGNNSYMNGTWRAMNGSTGLAGNLNESRALKLQNAGSLQHTSTGIDFAKRNTLLLHMVSDASNGRIEYWLNGTKRATYTGAVNGGATFNNFFLQSESSAVCFSNVIISDEEIGLNENARMPFELINDTKRNLLSYTVFSLNADTSREVQATFNLSCDTIKKVPHMILLDALI